MTSSITNPRVTEISQRTRNSYTAFEAFLAGPLASLDSDLLYQIPETGEWTIMQNLAHVVEFLPYWGDEISKLVAEPGKNFGRTMQQPRRLQEIEEHKLDTLEQIRDALPVSYAHLERVLNSLTDSDLDLTGVHVKYGERSLDWFIEEFVTRHMEDHQAQVHAALTTLQADA